jgi:hypothetical protein
MSALGPPKIHTVTIGGFLVFTSCCGRPLFDLMGDLIAIDPDDATCDGNLLPPEKWEDR